MTTTTTSGPVWKRVGARVPESQFRAITEQAHALGMTQAEYIRQALAAHGAWHRALADHDIKPPTGAARVTLELPAATHTAVVRQAARLGVTRTAYLLDAVRVYVDWHASRARD